MRRGQHHLGEALGRMQVQPLRQLDIEHRDRGAFHHLVGNARKDPRGRQDHGGAHGQVQAQGPFRRQPGLDEALQVFDLLFHAA
jgi:hypothetical protein